MRTDELTEMVPADESDPRIQAALAELRELILRHYPAATFTVYRKDSWEEGIYLTPVVEVDDLDEVASVFMERLIDMQVDEGFPIFVVPDWPSEHTQTHPHRNEAQSVTERLSTCATP